MWVFKLRHFSLPRPVAALEAIAGKPQLAVTEQPEAPYVALVTPFANRLPTLKEAEEALIPEALSRADGNQGVTAGLLSISRQALNKRLSRHKYPGRTAERPHSQ